MAFVEEAKTLIEIIQNLLKKWCFFKGKKIQRLGARNQKIKSNFKIPVYASECKWRVLGVEGDASIKSYGRKRDEVIFYWIFILTTSRWIITRFCSVF